MSSQRPFRTAYHLAFLEEVEARNQRHDHQGARQLEPTLQAIERIQSQQHANSDRIDSWAEHPDERVQVALIRAGTQAQTRNDRADWWGGRQGKELLDRLWKQHTRRARQEDVHWTPVLDELVQGLRARDGYQKHYGGLDESKINDQLAPVGRWLAEEARLPEVWELLNFRSRRIGGLVARCSRVISPKMARELFQYEQGWGGWNHPGQEMGKNEHLDGAQLLEIARVAAEIIDERASQIDENTDEHDPTFLYDQNRARDRSLRGTTGFVRELWQRREELPHWPEEIADALIPHMPRETSYPRRSWRQPLAVVAREIAPAMSSEQLEATWEHLDSRRQDAAPLLSFEHGPESLWKKGIEAARKWAGEGADNRLLCQLAQNTRALQQPWVQEALLEADLPPALYRAAQHGPPDLLDKATRRLKHHLQKALAGTSNRTGKDLLEWNLEYADSKEELHQLYDICSSHGNMVNKILGHPAADVDFAWHVLQDTRCQNVRQWIARTKDWRSDQRIYEKLQSSQDTRIIKPLLKDAPGADFPDLLKRFVQKNPEKGLKLLKTLEQEDDSRLERLAADHLTPLLSHSERAIRQEALMLAGRLELGDPAAPKAPQPANARTGP